MKTLFFTVVLSSCTFVVFSQKNQISNQATLAATNIYTEEFSRNEPPPPMFNYFRSPKPISYTFSGYKIQLIVSSKPLEASHFIFNDFGKVAIEKIGDKYCYSIGEFKSIRQAADFSNRVLSRRYLFYRIIEYQYGSRYSRI